MKYRNMLNYVNEAIQSIEIRKTYQIFPDSLPKTDDSRKDFLHSRHRYK